MELRGLWKPWVEGAHRALEAQEGRPYLGGGDQRVTDGLPAERSQGVGIVYTVGFMY